MKDILVIGKDSKYGLTKDGTLLIEAIEALGSGQEIVRRGIRERSWWDRLLGRRVARHAFHIERIFPRWYSASPYRYVIPNQERFPHRHLHRLKKVDLVLAKSHHAVEVFRAYGARVEYLGFTSEDRQDVSVARDWSGFLHLAGGSTLKGTEDVLDLWRKHPEWPVLTLVHKTKEPPKDIPANVHLINRYMDDAELRNLQNRMGIHLCPSRAEGWGHHMVESMSTGALLMTTDAPPMNEHVDAGSALMVAYHRTEPRRIGTNFYVDPAALETAIERAIVMPDAEKQALGAAARLRYEAIVAGFQERLRLFLTQGPGARS
jgi:hypothetical protein